MCATSCPGPWDTMVTRADPVLDLSTQLLPGCGPEVVVTCLTPADPCLLGNYKGLDIMGTLPVTDSSLEGSCPCVFLFICRVGIRTCPAVKLAMS